MTLKWVGSIILTALLGAGPSAAQESIATVSDLTPEAQAGLGAERTLLITGAQLREGETVVTGQNGEVQVLFSDQTHLVIGRGSSLVIARYLMRADGTPQKFAINALSGTFRFITGKGEKSAYAINTPTGTMGVRGTEFDFTVDRYSGHTSVILFEGGVRLCGKRGDCVELSERCSVGEIDLNDGAGVLTKEADRRKAAKTEFPYVQSQASLMQDFRVGKPQQCASPVQVAEEKVIKPGKILAPPVDTPPEVVPPDDPVEEPVASTKNNKGGGNGGEGAEGPSETENPGKHLGHLKH
ncbi:MAG: FecR domain-containing protein [Rubrivivax sp.]